MKVLIIGLPYFSKKLADNLSLFDKTNTYLSYNTFESIKDKGKYFYNLLSCDVVYLIGGTIRKSKSIDLAFFMNKKVIMHWVGTDILSALDDYKDNQYLKKYIENTIHFCEVDWIQDELKQINIEAKIIQIATFENKQFELYELPEKFSILSYIGKGREKFYGMDKLIQLANDFPKIEFKVAGICEYEKPVPENMKLLGWISNMDDQYRNCVLFLRLPEHDGLSFSVLEALSFCRYVGYSHNFINTYCVNDYNRLQKIVIDLYHDFNTGLLRANYSGVKFIKENYNENVVLGNLINNIKMQFINNRNK